MYQRREFLVYTTVHKHYCYYTHMCFILSRCSVSFLSDDPYNSFRRFSLNVTPSPNFIIYLQTVNSLPLSVLSFTSTVLLYRTNPLFNKSQRLGIFHCFFLDLYSTVWICLRSDYLYVTTVSVIVSEIRPLWPVINFSKRSSLYSSPPLPRSGKSRIYLTYSLAIYVYGYSKKRTKIKSPGDRRRKLISKH